MAQYSFVPPPVAIPALVVTDYALVKEVLGRDAFKSPFEGRVRKLLQAANTSAAGDGWSVVPRVVSSDFCEHFD